MVDELDQYAAQWREQGAPPAPEIHLTVTDQAPRIGETIRVQWHTTVLGQDVTVFHNGIILLTSPHARGHIDVTIQSVDRLELRVECADVERRCHISPVIRVPIIEEFTVSTTTHLGNPMTVRARVRDAVTLAVDVTRDGDEVPLLSRVVEAAELHLDIPINVIGAYQVRLHAQSADYAIAEQATVSEQQRLNVIHPPADIHIFNVNDTNPIIGESAVQLCWAVTNTQRVWLQYNDRQMLLPAFRGQCTLEVPVTDGAVNYTLVAQNLAGEAVSTSLEVHWRYPPVELHLDVSNKQLHVGLTHTVTWQVAGCSSVQLKLVQGHYQQDISTESNGQLSVRLFDTAHYLLSAIGADGHCYTRRVIVYVKLMPERYVYLPSSPVLPERSALPSRVSSMSDLISA